MISIQDQISFSAKIPEYSDKDLFAEESDLLRFKLIEEAGNVLPTFELIFLSWDTGVFSYLHEGYTIETSIGINDNKKITSLLTPTGFTAVPQGPDRWEIRIKGLYSAQNYITPKNTIITADKSGVAVIKDVAFAHFDTDFNINVSNDSQRWNQQNISDKMFVNNIWLHSYIPDSFVGIGITSDGTFRLRDMKKARTLPHDWNFTRSIENPNKDIVHNGDLVIASTGGFTNSWMGYGQEKRVYTLEDGLEELQSLTSYPQMATTSKLAQDPLVGPRFQGFAMQSGNVHSDYEKAYMQNMVNLALFSSVKVQFSFTGVFEEVKVLDTALLSDSTASFTSDSSEETSGKYWVTKVARIIEARKLYTVVVLNRESLSRIK